MIGDIYKGYNGELFDRRINPSEALDNCFTI